MKTIYRKTFATATATAKTSRRGNDIHHPNAGVTSRLRSIDDQLKKTTSRSFIAREIEVRTKFKAWYRSFKAKMANSLLSSNGPIPFLMNSSPSSSSSSSNVSSPFPNNPLFLFPSPPLTEEFRWSIYNEWKNDPIKWTPRRLSFKFNCSIKRIEAVLILKDYHSRLLKKETSSSFSPKDLEYSKEMEKNLASKARPIGNLSHLNKIPPPPPPSSPKTLLSSIPPLLVAIPKDSSITPEVAAILLQRHIANTSSNYAILQNVASGKLVVPSKSGDVVDPDLPFSPSINIEGRTLRPWTVRENIGMKGKFIQNDSWEHHPKRKTIWTFLDSSLPTRIKDIYPLGITLIRESNGDLRESNLAEHQREYKRMNTILKDHLINVPFTKRDQTLGTDDSRTALKKRIRALRNEC